MAMSNHLDYILAHFPQYSKNESGFFQQRFNLIFSACILPFISILQWNYDTYWAYLCVKAGSKRFLPHIFTSLHAAYILHLPFTMLPVHFLHEFLQTIDNLSLNEKPFRLRARCEDD